MSTRFELEDRRHMAAALALAREGLGRVWPNPSVGCVLVADGRVVGLGRTADGGRPHAEMVAVGEAGAAARGATAYVTLEPCSHWGQTPPCCEALAEAQVATVVVAVRDPDPRVNGKGILWLEERGMRVLEGLGTAEAMAVNAGFFCRIQRGRPLVVMTAARDEALARLAASFDAVAAHAVFAGLERPQIAFALDELVSLFDGAAAFRLRHASDDRGGSGQSILVPSARSGEEAHAALAALGELGLTRLLVHCDDPIARALEVAGLVDEQAR